MKNWLTFLAVIYSLCTMLFFGYTVYKQNDTNNNILVSNDLTPTLAMLAERQSKISGFVKEKYRRVRLDMNTDCTDGSTITAQSEQIKDPQEAANIQMACHNRQAICTSITKEQKSISSPKLFALTAFTAQEQPHLCTRRKNP